jgi:ATP dependent DNA ligase domain
VVIDGEITALDQNGRASFQLLQSYKKTEQSALVYYAFDLLFLEDTDLRSRPLTERRKALAKLLKKAPDNIRFSEELRGSADELLKVARQFQLEGLVAKRPDSVYESGRRSGAWGQTDDPLHDRVKFSSVLRRKRQGIVALHQSVRSKDLLSGIAQSLKRDSVLSGRGRSATKENCGRSQIES